ncbi:hypothetical protein COY07_04830, partial [Candidatus Peregrinibacteria bacterium CG_4_10_14_0_2_um_filter_43_11]
EKLKIKTVFFHSSWALTLTAGLSYFLGYLRDRILAQHYGFSRGMDIYNAAFVIPENMLSILVGAALSAAFLPIFAKQYDQKKQWGFEYTHQIIFWASVTLVIVGGVIAITLPFFVDTMVPGFDTEAQQQYILFTRLLLISPLIMALSNIYGRMLLSFKEFFWYGLSPALYNLGIVMGAIYLAPTMGMIGLVFGALLGSFLHLSIRLMQIRRKKYHFRHKLDLRFSPELKETLKLTAPKIVQYFMWAFMLFSFTRIASQLTEGSIVVYNYARNLQSVPVSLLGIAIALAMYPSLSHDAAKGNFKKFLSDFKRDRMRSLVYTGLAAIITVLTAKQLITLFFGGGEFGEKEINWLTTMLQIYAISIPLESLMHAYHRAYYSLKNTLVPAAFHTITIAITIIIAKTLAPTIGVYAIPIGFAAGSFLQIMILGALFPYIFRKKWLK